jgi:hypothetical protein
LLDVYLEPLPARTTTVVLDSFRRNASGVVDTRRSALAAAILILGVAGSSPSRAGQSPPSDLRTALTSVRAAFLENDARQLCRRFPARTPVYVEMRPFVPGSFLGPGPLEALLARLVRERTSIEFDLPADLPNPPARSPGSVWVKARWTYRPAASDTLHVDYLHLALRFIPEDAAWQIVVMKTSSR